MAETISLDPSEVATNRTELTLTSGAITILEEGPNWGDAEISAYMAEQSRGESPVDFRVPNRQIAIPLRLQTNGTVTFVQARTKLQQKVALIQQQGGWLKRITSGGGTLFADIVNATLHLSGGWLQATSANDIEATLGLEAIPDFYGAEVTLSDHIEVTATELIFTETTIKGDYPGRVRIVVDDDQAQNQRGLLWAFRSRSYSSATTAATAYEAEALQTLDTAVKAAKAGASGGTVVTHGTLSTNWTPVVGTNMGGTSYLTHTGTNRVYARVFSTSGTLVQGRFTWDVGDMVNPSENSPKRLYNNGTFHILDLGEIRLDPAPTGSHRWQGQVQFKGEVGGEAVSVDRLWIVNQDDGAGVLSAPTVFGSGGNDYIFSDSFNQTAGTATGKTSTTGQVWAGAGDADDFSIDTTNHYLQRTAVSDAADGRFLTLGTTPSALAASSVAVNFKFSAASATFCYLGVLARYVDTSNFLQGYLVVGSAAAGTGLLQVVKRVAGVTTVLSSTANVSVLGFANYWYSLQLTVDAAGNWGLGIGLQSGEWTNALAGTDSVLATGGVLDDGKVGIYDAQTTATANTRSYDNFFVNAPFAGQPLSDAVIFASRSAELGTKGIYRLDSGGTAYGPVSQVVGDLPRIPPAGLEGRTTEVFLKASRGDFATLADPGIDDISAKVFYRPSFLFAPTDA